jgi:hypothetical protein
VPGIEEAELSFLNFKDRDVRHTAFTQVTEFRPSDGTTCTISYTFDNLVRVKS